MEKSKKKIGAKIAAALVACTALTCCFVGTTFAKYTSAVGGTATVNVAKWEVVGISENTEQITSFVFEQDELSPAYAEGETQNILTSTDITITNNSGVSAIITAEIVAEGLTVTYVSNAPTTYQDKASEVFTVSVTDADGNAVESITLGTEENNKSVTLKVALVWNTLETNDTQNGDEIDTYFGMYAESVAFTFNLRATQGSKLPA